MRTLVVFLAAVAVAVADVKHLYLAPIQSAIQAHHAAPLPAHIYPSDNSGYRFNYQLSDGQMREESAQIQQTLGYGAENSDAIVRVQGSYSYVDPVNGKTYTVRYWADESGYHAEGAHLPVAPKAAGY